MADPEAVKRALARLAAGETGPPAHRPTDDADPEPDIDVVARAVACVEDLSAAAAFADAGGVERLRRALDARAAPDPAGERALRAFERYRAACRGQFHSHSGHGRDLGRDRKGTSE